MRFDSLKINVTAAGSAGSATGATTTTAIVEGRIYSVHLDYSTGHTTGTDVVLKTAGTNMPSFTVLSLTNNKTDGWYYPRVAAHTTTGGATGGSAFMLAVFDALQLTVAATDPNETVTAYVLLER